MFFSPTSEETTMKKRYQRFYSRSMVKDSRGFVDLAKKYNITPE
jgi:hypothetical protein